MSQLSSVLCRYGMNLGTRLCPGKLSGYSYQSDIFWPIFLSSVMLRRADLYGEFSYVLMDYFAGFCKKNAFKLILATFYLAVPLLLCFWEK